MPDSERAAVSERPDGPTARLLPRSDLPTVERRAAMMGTDIQVLVLGDGDVPAAQVADAALAEMARIEALMSEWRDDSLLSAVNRAAGHHPVAVTPELMRLLVESARAAELSAGAFDITFAGAGRLWDFKHPDPQPPTATAVAAALATVGHVRLILDQAAGTAFLHDPGMRIGLGGIAKGYAVDRAAQVVAKHGFTNFAVNAGGDLCVRGRRGERRWSVAIRDPRQADQHLAVIPVSNAAVVTSGDYERFFIHQGRRYAHIIDPRTGWPVDHCQSVTVVAERTYWADALATAVFVLGPERGLALIESLPDAECLIVDADGRPRVSSGLATSGN